MKQILTFVLWLAAGAAQQAANGSVEGTVMRTGTTDPIEHVQVTLTSGAAAPRSKAVTDKEGHFSFSNVSPGRYIVGVQRDGYLVPGLTLPASTVQSAPSDSTAMVVSVNVGSSEHVRGLTYYLTPGATISGRILDPLGRPSAVADVYALRLAYHEGRPILSPVKATSSNDRGEYRIYWLEAGDYIVRAEKVLPTGPVRAYYPGAAKAADSVKIRVLEGMESPKIDLVLQQDETFKISGTVTNIVASMQDAPIIVTPSPVDGEPIDPENRPTKSPVEAAQASSRQLQFYLSPDDPDELYDGVWTATNVLTSARDRAAGKFELRNIRPGFYTLIAIATDRSAALPRYYVGRTRVEVAFQDVHDLNLLIAPGRDITGRIIYSRNVSAVATLRVQLQPKGFLPVLPLGPALSGVPEADGSFMIPNVPDLPYSVFVLGLPRDAYVADLRQGSFSIFDVGTVVPGRRVNDEFEVLVDSPGAKITGKVTLPNGKVVAGAAVALVPDERRQENLLLYKRTNASEAGLFSFTGVAPGRYRLFAAESIPEGAEFNAEFRDAIRDDVREITVAPGDTTVVELRLNSR
jgi:hypothetical protein